MRPSIRGFSWLLLAIVGAGFGAAACGNPAVDARIDALGGELDGVEPGEYHRPGQPCVLCHGKYGGAEPLMSVGGTIFATKIASDSDQPVPVEGITVSFIDAAGISAKATTNCIGNFFISKEDYDPSFPLHVELEYQLDGGTPRRSPMNSRISRDGSCAGCHVGAPNQGSPGIVYVVTSNSPFPPPGNDCPGIP